jgi:hypothetical protein
MDIKMTTNNNEFDQYVALLQSMLLDYMCRKNTDDSPTKKTVVANLKMMIANMEKLIEK